MTRLRTLTRLAALSALVAVLAACGARGRPLPPLRIVPDTIRQTVATRIGDRVYLEFDAPDSDSDNTTPGDIEWIEVYAVTTQPTVRRPQEEYSEDWLDAATLVAVLPVRPAGGPPLDPEPALEELLDEVQNRDAVAAPVAFFEVVQGETVTVVERLTPETLLPVTVGEEEEEDEDEEGEKDDRPVPMPLVGPRIPDPPIRSYVAFGVSSRGRMAEPSNLVDVPLVTPPLPPGAAAVTYFAMGASVAWEQPPTFRLPVQAELVQPPALQSRPVLAGHQQSMYVVYDLAASGDPDVEQPEQLARLPGSATQYFDPDVVFTDTRCYAVSVLDLVGEFEVLGDASPATCVVLTDTFQPLPPSGLIAVADTAGITLVWNENTEADLAGYLVLRRTAADETLQALTVEPLVSTTYQDTDVIAGERYFYQVQAVDNAVPPNVSPPSTAVTEVAR